MAEPNYTLDGYMAPGSNSLLKTAGPLDKIKFITGTDPLPDLREDPDLIFDIMEPFLVRIRTWSRLTETQIINRFQNDIYPVVIYFIPGNQKFAEFIVAYPPGSQSLYMVNSSEWSPYVGKVRVTRNGVIYIKHSEAVIVRLTLLLQNGDKPYIDAVLSPDRKSYQVSIDFKSYPNGFYRTGFDAYFAPYTGPFLVTRNTVIYAYGKHDHGYEDIVSETATAMLFEIFIPRPVIRFRMAPDMSFATVDIDFNGLPLMYYKTDMDLSWIGYTEPVEINKNTVIYAKAGFEENTFSFVSMLPIEQII